MLKASGYKDLKSFYRAQLTEFFTGNIKAAQEEAEAAQVLETKEEVEFWEWDMCIVFKNPDAQKGEKKMSTGDAFELITKIFKKVFKQDDQSTQAYRKAECEVFTKLLEGMADADGKVKTY